MSTNVTAPKLIEKLTGNVRTLRFTKTDSFEEENGEINPWLVDELNVLEDFVRNDPEDTIFEEYDSPIPRTQTSFDWKSCRPPLLTSVVHTAWMVLQLIILGGLLGGFGVIYFYMDINTADYCHWASVEELGRLRRRIRVLGVTFEVFPLAFWQFLILWTIFKWPLLKELNLLTLTLISAFGDVSYRLLLYIFDAYKPPWIPYPQNVLFGCLVFYSSFAVARRVCPNVNSKVAQLKLAFKLCSQILIALPTSLFLNYFVFSWFAQTPPGLKRAMIAAVVPMISIPCKVVAKLCATHLEGINPGTSHVLVAVAYGTFSIVFRTLQANIENFGLFIVLSIGSGVIHVIEKMTVPLRDYYLDKILLSCCQCCQRRRRQDVVRSPRSQRLTADMGIHEMLFETTTNVYSIAVLYVYYLVYGISENKWTVFRVEVAERIPTALAVEFVFNSISVLFQTRYMNIPVIRIWKRNWKKHLTFAFITTTLTILYFTGYQLQLIRVEYGKFNDTLPLMENCTKPFH